MTQALFDMRMVDHLLNKIRSSILTKIHIMEVCGTHTHAISRFSFRQTLSEHVDFISGPGCPVCVTSQSDVDKMIAYACLPNTITATFGDMMRVPGSSTSLNQVKAEGADIRVVFSPMDAVSIAKNFPAKEVIFIGIGFETTAPIVATTLRYAKENRIPNYSVLSFHKTLPRALATLFSQEHNIDGLLLPGHVSAILGTRPFEFLATGFKLPAAVTGFTPIEILQAVQSIADMATSKQPRLVNAYPRVVTTTGNILAQTEITEVFADCDSDWRGLGTIQNSGLVIRADYRSWDAEQRFSPSIEPAQTTPACRCGSVIMGQMKPHQCPLFKVECTPQSPQGPCMVSGEGACAAYYQYDRHYLSKEV